MKPPRPIARLASYATLLLVLLAGCGEPKLEGPTKTVLFLGNSLTYVNDLPKTLSLLAGSGGHPLQVDSFAQGGWTLAQHAGSEEALGKVSERKWDFVVLQEQSFFPAIPANRTQSMYPAVRVLDTKIRQNGSQPLLFLAWARKAGYPEIGYKDYRSMQDALTEGYQGIAHELNIDVSPVGLAWKTAVERRDDLGLWGPDGLHPAMAGTYLAACVFYSVLYRQSPEGLRYRAELPKDVATFLQQVAAETVLKGPNPTPTP